MMKNLLSYWRDSIHLLLAGTVATRPIGATVLSRVAVSRGCPAPNGRVVTPPDRRAASSRLGVNLGLSAHRR
jgi:hypothetical protein